MGKISALSFARVVAPEKYAAIALGDHDAVQRHEVQCIADLGERTAGEVWKTVKGSDLILCSGSALDVGKWNEETSELEPNFDPTVKELTAFFQFLLIQSHLGNPQTKDYLLLANCFSAQTLAFAMVLTDALIKNGIDLSALQDPDDIHKKYSPEQTWAENKPPFPIAKPQDTQLGLMPTNRREGEHWIFNGFDPDRGFLYVHNQAILLEVLASLKHIKPEILAHRALPILQKGEATLKDVVDIFSVSGGGASVILGTQPHLDYGLELKHLIGVLEAAKGKPQFARIFRPGTGGINSDGTPRSIEKLLDELREAGFDVNGYQAIENCLEYAGLAA